MESFIKNEFNRVLNKLTEEERHKYILSWFDLSMANTIMCAWDSVTKRKAINKINDIINSR